MPLNPPTMLEIARACGVSRPAVSFALNGRAGRLADDTRERILRTAERLGYRPNQGATAVRTGRFGAYGLLLGPSCYLPPALLRGLTDACGARDAHLVVAECDDARFADPAALPRMLRQVVVDGLIIDRADPPPAAVRAALDRLRLPLRWLNQRLGLRCIHPDDAEAAERLVAELAARGYRRIAFSGLLGGGKAHCSWRDRLAGYRAGMRRVGQRERILCAREPAADGAGRVRLAGTHLAGAEAPDAVICYSGRAVASYLSAARLAGMAVPTDLALAAFTERHEHDDGGYAIGGMPMPWEALAAAALASLAEGAERPADIAVPYGSFTPGGTVRV